MQNKKKSKTAIKTSRQNLKGAANQGQHLGVAITAAMTTGLATGLLAGNLMFNKAPQKTPAATTTPTPIERNLAPATDKTAAEVTLSDLLKRHNNETVPFMFNADTGELTLEYFNKNCCHFMGKNELCVPNEFCQLPDDAVPAAVKGKILTVKYVKDPQTKKVMFLEVLYIEKASVETLQSPQTQQPLHTVKFDCRALINFFNKQEKFITKVYATQPIVFATDGDKGLLLEGMKQVTGDLLGVLESDVPLILPGVDNAWHEINNSTEEIYNQNPKQRPLPDLHAGKVATTADARTLA